MRELSGAKLAGLLLASALCGGQLSADFVIREEPPEPAPEPVHGAISGQKFVLDLLQDEKIIFVWIGPLDMWVGKFEITNAQYNRFNMHHESLPYYGHRLDAPDQPVVWVSWEDANNYCVWLTKTFGKLIPPGFCFRLPDEDEWQAFASCKDIRKYPWGSYWPPPDTYNYRGEEGAGFLYRLFHREPYIMGHNDGFVATCPVTESGANRWGLFGVGGNVWEWCRNWFDENRIEKALRGAGWNNHEMEFLSVDHRSGTHPRRSNPTIGFRIVIAPARRQETGR